MRNRIFDLQNRPNIPVDRQKIVIAYVITSAIAIHIPNSVTIRPRGGLLGEWVNIIDTISAWLSSLSTLGTGFSPGPSVGLSVCLSVGLPVRKVYCGKMAEWIRMPFGVVSGSVEGWVY